MAANKFLVFDENSGNLLSDVEYATDTQRLNGITTGQARSILHNKIFRQISMMASAIGQIIADGGTEANDSSLINLVSAINTHFKTAAKIAFSNATSGLSATNVQTAIDELNAEKAGLVDGKIPKALLPSVGGAIVSATAPVDTDLLWIDTSVGGILKYYSGGIWLTVKYAYE